MDQRLIIIKGIFLLCLVPGISRAQESPEVILQRLAKGSQMGYEDKDVSKIQQLPPEQRSQLVAVFKQELKEAHNDKTPEALRLLVNLKTMIPFETLLINIMLLLEAKEVY